MCRTRLSWRQKFTQFNLWIALYSSWALGLFPFIYNRKSGKLRRSFRLLGYSIVLNVTLVWVAFRYNDATETGAKLELFKRNPLAKQINSLHNILLLMTIFVMHLRNWWESAELCKIINELLRIHQRYLQKYDTSDCFNYDNYIIYKGSSIMLELASILTIEFALSPKYTIKMFFGLISLLLIQQGVLYFGMHFTLAVIHIYRAVWIINRELLRLVNRLSIEKTVESSNVHRLHSLYSRLLDINIRLIAIYDYQITLLMMSLLTVNIISIFYIIVYSISMKKPITFLLVFNFMQALFINIMDFWLNISVCELAERASRGTATILKLFNNIPQLDAKLERSLNDFALFCSHQRLKFNHCGLFEVHNAMGFRMVITCALYLVYLVQFDFMNL